MAPAPSPTATSTPTSSFATRPESSRWSISSRTKAAEKTAKHGLQAKVFKNCDELLEGCDFDAASICLPPFEHAPAAVALLRAGKHVLIEKPMATCLEECDQMLDAARAGRRLLGVVAQNRFKTPMMKLKRVLESGLIGKILHAQVDSFWWRGSNYYDLWWRGTWAKEGGGCTMNHAVHQIDLFLWMMGMPAEVQSVSLNLATRTPKWRTSPPAS